MDHQHWTYDPDLLERYVLDRLESAQREELENHLKTCEQCRIAVREEEELAAGVRRLAREEFKTRLKSRFAGLQSEPIREVPWFQLAAAAAVIVILVGVGIYNEWFTWYKEKDITEEYQREQPASGAAQEQEFPPPVPEAAGERSGISSDRRIPTEAEKRQEHAASTQKIIREAQREKQIARNEHILLENGAGAGVRREDVELEGVKEWVQGEILSTLSERLPPQSAISTIDKGALLKTDKSELRKQAESEIESRPSRKSRTRSRLDSVETDKAGQRIIVQQGVRSQIIILSQRPKSQLSPEQLRDSQTVPTLVERTEEGLQFTVYLDQPVGDEELRNATIEPIHRDSVILHLGSQQIGYRIPSGWFSKSPAK